MLLSPEEIIEAICPELAGSPSLQVYLGMAAESVDRGFFGSLYNHAVAYKAAHLFTLMNNGTSGDMTGELARLGGGAPIASVSEGGLSVSFAHGSGGTDATALGSTRYGKLFLEVLKSRPKMGVNQAGGFYL
jgi:hypothetical protein